MPHFMTEDDVVAAYTRFTGKPVTDLHWYVVYGLLRHAIVMARIAHRSAHFGESVLPDDPDDLVMHRDLLDRSMA
jgi:aminoglycoside phosphotransferase (APT) family kinase protein